MSKKIEKPTKLLWLDMEMTGVDAQLDRILEVAAIVTDFSFKELATYEAQIVHDEKKVKKLLLANAWWAARPNEMQEILEASRLRVLVYRVEKPLVSLAFRLVVLPTKH